MSTSDPRDPDNSFLNGLDSASIDPLEEDDGLDFSVDDFLPDEDTQKFIRRSPISKCLNGILMVFRFPEAMVGKLYRSSAVRSLLYRFDWYADLADQQELGSIIEDTYGGPRGVLFRIRRFIRGNLLFTLLAVVGIYIGGRALMPVVFQQDAVRTVLGASEFDEEKSMTQLKEAKKTAGEVLDRRSNLKEEIQNCIFTDSTREHVLNAIDDDGRLSDNVSVKVMASVRRYRDRYNQAGFATAADAATERLDKIGRHLSTAAVAARKKTKELQARNAKLQRLNKVLKQELATLEAKGTGDVLIVNEAIKVRDRLNANEDSLYVGPSDAELELLLQRLDEMEIAFAGNLPVDYRVVTVEEPYKQWYSNMVWGNLEQAGIAADKFGKLGILKSIQSFDDPSRALIGDSVHTLTTLIDRAITASRKIDHAPAIALNDLINEEQTINHQIDGFLGTSNGRWIDHRPCLAEDGIAIDVSVVAD